uniref:Prominin 2 n=1 Tax=Anolis carolinensis TaxID=28377 RepID=A0A803TCR2_ANOCA|nr:PREDICTED: prominin-1-A [Anolis carolinensis]XP_008114272.1 PREDICTED: prominin-1-A [Anolis carolinensis]|eukprot:XP_008114271.1 PREDICTED: prominin-1-A [Anolis carolinensis]
MSLSNFTQPQYVPQLSNSSGGLQGLFNMVHSFLGLVQPNSFPEGLLTRLIKPPHEFTPEFLKEVLLYETGFLVCAAIGVLYIILVPLVGLFFCCCRCCGRCGGYMYQKQTKHIDCKRRSLFVSVLAVTIIILAGDICAYISNQRMSQTVGKGVGNLNSTVDNLHRYLNSIPQEVDEIIDVSSVPLNQTNASLLNIGITLGKKIQTQLGGKANKALDTADNLLRVIATVEQELKKVNDSSSRLQMLQKELDQNLTILRDDINRTLDSCGHPCQNVSVKDLRPGGNLTGFPDISVPMELITNLTRLDPGATLTEARKTLENIPEKVSNETKSVVSDAENVLRNIKDQIHQMRANFSILNFVENVSDTINEIIGLARTYEPEAATYDRYRWIVCVILCCLVLLIIVLNVLGLLFGALGLDPQEMPIQRSCPSNSGGLLLMASAGFSFIFSWLLMLLVLVTFLIGGNTYELVCRPWASGRLLEFLETPGLIPDFNVSQLMDNSDVTLSSMYNSCKNNDSLWSTLHLNKTISLDEMFNISKYTDDIDSTLNKINVSVDSTNLLNDDQKRLMQDLSKKDGPLKMNFSDALEQINQSKINQDLSALAAKLDNLATQLGSRHPNISAKLQNHAAEVRNVQTSVNDKFPPEIQNLNNSIRILEKSVSEIPGLVNSTLSEVEVAQEFMKQKTGEIIKNETLTFVNSILGFFQSYMDWAKSKIEDEVGRCGPVAWAINSIDTIFCGYIVDSWNGFWFSLGWCTIFLLPSIILAVKLARFYRRMSMDDIYVDEAMELSRQRMFKMPRAELKK